MVQLGNVLNMNSNAYFTIYVITRMSVKLEKHYICVKVRKKWSEIISETEHREFNDMIEKNLAEAIAKYIMDKKLIDVKVGMDNMSTIFHSEFYIFKNKKDIREFYQFLKDNLDD